MRLDGQVAGSRNRKEVKRNEEVESHEYVETCRNQGGGADMRS